MANPDFKDSPEARSHRAAVAARLAGVSPARLRRYERAGLLSPARGQGRLRLYSTRQVAELRRIRRLNEVLGINLAGIDVILRLVEQVKTLQSGVGTQQLSERLLQRNGTPEISGRRTADGRE